MNPIPFLVAALAVLIAGSSAGLVVPCCCGGGGAATACCPGVPLPNTLHATLTSGNCPNLNGVGITLTYQADWGSAGYFGMDGWGAVTNPAPGGTHEITLILNCKTAVSQWQLMYECINSGGFVPQPGSTCTPFSQVFSVSGIPQGCCPAGGAAGVVTVTITL